MLTEYVAYILIATYLSVFGVTSAALQWEAHKSDMICYQPNTALMGIARQDQSYSNKETAVCDFPAITRHDSVERTYSIGDRPLGSMSIIISFNETITRNTTGHPLNYVIEGHGIVKNGSDPYPTGYHARELITNMFDVPSKCDSNGGYTQTVYGKSYLVVFDNNLLSEQNRDVIRSEFTFAERQRDIDVYSLFHNTLNGTGLVCYGEITIRLWRIETVI